MSIEELEVKTVSIEEGNYGGIEKMCLWRYRVLVPVFGDYYTAGRSTRQGDLISIQSSVHDRPIPSYINLA